MREHCITQTRQDGRRRIALLIELIEGTDGLIPLAHMHQYVIAGQNRRFVAAGHLFYLVKGGNGLVEVTGLRIEIHQIVVQFQLFRVIPDQGLI